MSCTIELETIKLMAFLSTNCPSVQQKQDKYLSIWSRIYHVSKLLCKYKRMSCIYRESFNNAVKSNNETLSNMRILLGYLKAIMAPLFQVCSHSEYSWADTSE
jgi:nitrate reductase gamma subunit